ncbi:hypothetical protein TWF281_004169 [Arthrobotrys megalospora]
MDAHPNQNNSLALNWVLDVDAKDIGSTSTSPLVDDNRTDGTGGSFLTKDKPMVKTIERSVENDFLLGGKRKREALQPTDLVHSSEPQIRDLIFPSDSLSQVDVEEDDSSITPPPTRASGPSKTALQRERLSHTVPKFTFLSASGRRGLTRSEKAEDRVPSSLQLVVRHLREASSTIGSICRCVEGIIREHWPYEPWIEGTFSGPELDCQSQRRHSREARFIIENTILAEGYHSRMTEELGWVISTSSILYFAAGSTETFHPVFINSVTSVDVDRETLPVARNFAARNRSRSPTKKQRTSSPQASLGEEVFTARADIVVIVNLESKRVKDVNSQICNSFGEFPSPFGYQAQSPIVPIKCKSYYGSTLSAEFQSTLCASAMLESWCWLGNPTPIVLKEENILLLEAPSEPVVYPRLRKEEIIDGTTMVTEVGIDHVIALQIVSYIWSFNVTFIHPNDSANDGDNRPRKVLGPFIIGDSRTPSGLYAILRFLDRLFTYKVSVWLPGILQRGELP